MKIFIPLVISAFVAISSSQAALLTYTETGNVDTNSGVNFAFNKFNSALGTLSAIDLIINSSTPTGSSTVTNNSLTNNVTVRYINSTLDIDADAGLGFVGYAGSSVSLNTTPTAKSPTTFLLAKNSSQVFSVNGSQSLIGGTPIEFSISGDAFGSYLGSGSVSFTAYTSINLTTTGSTYSVNSSAYYAATSMTLRYTYTPAPDPSPVPEPSQVAASFLVLGVLGIYFIHRRRSGSLSN